MGTKLFKAAYEQLIKEDLKWLLKQPESLERDHIEAVIRASASWEYPKPQIPEQKDEKPQFVNEYYASVMLGITLQYMPNFIRTHNLIQHKIEGRWYFLKSDLEVLDKQRRSARNLPPAKMPDANDTLDNQPVSVRLYNIFRDGRIGGLLFERKPDWVDASNLTKIPLWQLSERVTKKLLLNFTRNCGKGTAREFKELLELYGLEFREE